MTSVHRGSKVLLTEGGQGALEDAGCTHQEDAEVHRAQGGAIHAGQQRKNDAIRRQRKKMQACAHRSSLHGGIGGWLETKIPKGCRQLHFQTWDGTIRTKGTRSMEVDPLSSTLP